jgi:predicted kinase
MTTDVAKSQRQRDTERILQSLQHTGTGRPVLVVLVGLPGVGKTHLATRLQASTNAVVMESDACRQLLFPERRYSRGESKRLFAAIHAAIDELLRRGVRVIVDATNVAERERTPLYALAEQRGAKLVLVHVTSPDALARERIQRRGSGVTNSEADLRVYEDMQWRVEAIRRPHVVVDTSDSIDLALSALTKEMQHDE